jgi:hypothetical protein
VCCHLQLALLEHTVRSPPWTQLQASATRKSSTRLSLKFLISDEHTRFIPKRWRCIPDTTINHPLGAPITLVAVLIIGQMWSALMMCSAQLDTTAPAPPRNSLVVVGNPIYLMFQIVHWLMIIPRQWYLLGMFFVRLISVALSRCWEYQVFFCRFYCRKGSTAPTSKLNFSLQSWNPVFLICPHPDAATSLLQDATRRALVHRTLLIRT